MRKQKRDVQVEQSAVQFPNRTTMAPHGRSAFIAQVIEVYSQRVTCDLKTHDGQVLQNIPVMSQAGTIAGAPYGTVSLPAIEDFVVVMYASYGTRHKVIVGTIFPYLANEFSKPPVNSGSKTTATTMLEADKPLEDKIILKSGTSVLIEEDGTITIETPDGTFFKLDVAAGTFELTDSNGNTIVSSASTVTINGNLEVDQ